MAPGAHIMVRNQIFWQKIPQKCVKYVLRDVYGCAIVIVQFCVMSMGTGGPPYTPKKFGVDRPVNNRENGIFVPDPPPWISILLSLLAAASIIDLKVDLQLQQYHHLTTIHFNFLAKLTFFRSILTLLHRTRSRFNHFIS